MCEFYTIILVIINHKSFSYIKNIGFYFSLLEPLRTPTNPCEGSVASVKNSGEF